MNWVVDECRAYMYICDDEMPSKTLRVDVNDERKIHHDRQLLSTEVVSTACQPCMCLI